MFKPHVTVACVVHAAGKFLIVEETINGKALWNQPAGHLEADETLVQAAERELWEETASAPPRRRFYVCTNGLRRIARRSCGFASSSSWNSRCRPSRTTATSIAACG